MKKEPLCRPNGMTREEAKSMFEDIRHYRYMESDVDVKTYDNLLDMAISALSAEVKRNCKECYHSTNGCMAGTETCHLCMYENQFEPKPSTEGEYIKKSELLQHVTTEELSDFKDCDVIHAEEIDELTTYSFPDSAENKPEHEKLMNEIQENRKKEVVIVPTENKGDLISRQAVLDELEKWDWQDLYLPSHFKQIIDDAPPADVRENIHARWIELPKAFNPNELPCKCSNPKCGEILSFMNGYPKSKFCPSCGAIMDGEPKDIIHEAIDNTTFAEEAYPNIKEELHKAVDTAEPKGEKGTE